MRSSPISEQRYRPNRPRIVDEIVDDEALIIDLTTGAYFSAVGVGAVAWAAIARGASVDEVAGALAARFSVDQGSAEHDLVAFVAELVAEDLLVEASDDSPADTAAPETVETTRPYGAPKLEKYTDLSDLILLDPVHDVSEAGWPQRQPNT
jgi:Coenzyme PQQ synthesis protein D (PqqD)